MASIKHPLRTAILVPIIATLAVIDTGGLRAQTLMQQMIQDAQQREAARLQQQQNQSALQHQQQEAQAAEDARVQAAKAAEAKQQAEIKRTWSSLDSTVRLCVERRLQTGGQSIDLLVSQAVAASDPRLQDVIGGCNAISSQRLMKKLACVVDATPTICNEEYVFVSAPTAPLNAEQLVTALVAGRLTEIGTTQIEDPAEKAKRAALVESKRKRAIAAQLLSKLQPLVTQDDNFSFKNADALRKTITASEANANTTIDQLTRWSDEVDRLVQADVNEKMRVDKENADMLMLGELRVSGSGAGPNLKVARLNSYYDIFSKQLKDVVGAQGDADLGNQYRKKAEADFDKFRTEFFTPDTIDKCSNSNQTTRCEVRGVFKVGVLKSDLQQVKASSAVAPSTDYRFILRYPDSDDEATTFLIAQISAEFINSGYKIISKSGEDEAEAKGAFDFYLNILEITQEHVQDVGGNFITYVLKARIKLMDNAQDPAKRQDLANVPVVNTKRTIRDPKTPVEARAKELLQLQGSELARQILHEVDARVATLPKKMPQAGATVTTDARPNPEYTIRITGLSQRDREQIKLLRDTVSKTLKLTAPTRVDPDKTDDKEVEITFDMTDQFDPEDVVDALYGAFKSRKTFNIKYNGSNAFVGAF